MPVWLDAIPEKAAKVKRPDTRRWLIFLAVVLLLGAAIVAWFWHGDRAGLIFWCSAIGLPLCLWGLIFSFRRVAYKAHQVGAQSWDIEREQLIKQETQRGQLPAWILDAGIEIRSGQRATNIVDAIETAFPVVERFVPTGKVAAIQYAALPNREFAAQQAIERLTRRITDVIAPLREDLSCWLLIDSDIAEESQTEKLILQHLNEQSHRPFNRITQNGMAGLDNWLDRTMDTPAILVAISAHLPESPQNGGADAFTALVLANRASHHYPDAARLHRPEKGSFAGLDKTLQRAVLWADLKAENLNGAWITGEAVTQGAAWSNACDICKVTFSMTDDLTVPDSVIGYTHISAPWLMIALAQSALEAEEAQAIACQSAPESDEVWVMVVRKEQEEKGLTGNV
ncbi:hypothetical protein [Pantoea sp. GM01]|uniref:hypothetical protein n=1 Tax=Pantoea sp. GM01 TaxID=1144320 RepID=UPI0002712C7A|nr:hypothetical protein [Pantoea sp. GM01]EJL90835.1 hypothetical protein PMI17_01374 [Pantoea sp. GM01]